MIKIRNLLTLRNFSVLFLLIIAIIFIYYFEEDSERFYETVLVNKGSIKSVVNTTGTIEPQIKADLIPHINGIVEEVYVDYNTRVRKGDVLALINPEQFRLNLKQADADLLKAKSHLHNTLNIYESNIKLFDKNLISRLELNNSKVNYSSSLANYEQANATFQKAQTDYENTRITAPIDGIIIDKNLTEGQVVSDRLDQRPIFTIVNNLDDMNIIAAVNEVDIGRLSVGNSAKFITDAYPEEEYTGIVKQIVSQPISLNNIVTYNIIIEFKNKNNLLKPGMTANVEILAHSKDNVLIVPKSALRFIPESHKDIMDVHGINSGEKILWVLDNNKELTPERVTTGIYDSTNIEITGGEVNAGDRIVTGYGGTAETNNTVGPIKIPGVKRF